jgi:hypothetical protein
MNVKILNIITLSFLSASLSLSLPLSALFIKSSLFWTIPKSQLFRHFCICLGICLCVSPKSKEHSSKYWFYAFFIVTVAAVHFFFCYYAVRNANVRAPQPSQAAATSETPAKRSYGLL